MNLREQQARHTYEHILLTAEKLLNESSYEELSVEQICECAGISKGGFYHHFTSKDQLISLLLGRQVGNLITERLAPHLKKKNALELLEIYVDTMAGYLEKTSNGILAKCWSALSEHPEMITASSTRDFFQILYRIVEQGKEEGSIRADLSNEFCQSYINGTITGIMIYGSAFQESCSLKTFAENSLKLLWKSISSQK